MSDAQLIDRMTALTMQIADRGTQAAEQDPTTARVRRHRKRGFHD